MVACHDFTASLGVDIAGGLPCYSRPSPQQEDANAWIILVEIVIRGEEIGAGHLFLDGVAKEFGGPIYDLAVYRHKIGLPIDIKKITVFLHLNQAGDVRRDEEPK